MSTQTAGDCTCDLRLLGPPGRQHASTCPMSPCVASGAFDWVKRGLDPVELREREQREIAAALAASPTPAHWRPASGDTR